jgi:hypothetical protein
MCNTCGCKSAEEINPVDSYIVDAPLGRGVAQFYSEGGESAVYEPSNEPMGSTPATEPTNENPVLFCSECGSRKAEGCGCFSAENESAVYEPSSEPSGESPATEPTNENPNLFGAETKMKSKSMFTKDKRGRMYARKRNGEIITHNSENESSPSSFNIRWEDSEGLSSPSLPPEGVYFAEHEGLYACSKCKHWNRNPVDGITKCKKCGNGSFKFVKRSEFVPNGDGRAIGSQTFEYNGTPLHAEEDTSFGSIGEGNNFGQMRAESLDDYTPMDSVVVDNTSYQPSQDYGADFLVEKPFRTGAYLSAGLLTGATLFGIVGMTLTNLIGNIMNKGE